MRCNSRQPDRQMRLFGPGRVDERHIRLPSPVSAGRELVDGLAVDTAAAAWSKSSRDDGVGRHANHRRTQWVCITRKVFTEVRITADVHNSFAERSS